MAPRTILGVDIAPISLEQRFLAEMPSVCSGIKAALYDPRHPFVVLSNGRVFRKINDTHPERKQWCEVKHDVMKLGYHRVTIMGERWLVHRLVYKVFVAPLIDGQVICHLDGDKGHNEPENLAQASQAENVGHKKLHGTWQGREKHPNAIYSGDVVSEVQQRLSVIPRYASGRVKRGCAVGIAKEMGVSKTLVYDLLNGGWPA